jgi:hypothetical protein
MHSGTGFESGAEIVKKSKNEMANLRATMMVLTLKRHGFVQNLLPVFKNCANFKYVLDPDLKSEPFQSRNRN